MNKKSEQLFCIHFICFSFTFAPSSLLSLSIPIMFVGDYGEFCDECALEFIQFF